MDWTKILEIYGPLAAIVIAGGWFFWKVIWPFLEKQLARAQERGDRSQDAFMAALERRDQIQADQTAKMQKGFERMLSARKTK